MQIILWRVLLDCWALSSSHIRHLHHVLDRAPLATSAAWQPSSPCFHLLDSTRRRAHLCPHRAQRGLGALQKESPLRHSAPPLHLDIGLAQAVSRLENVEAHLSFAAATATDSQTLCPKAIYLFLLGTLPTSARVLSLVTKVRGVPLGSQSSARWATTATPIYPRHSGLRSPRASVPASQQHKRQHRCRARRRVRVPARPGAARGWGLRLPGRNLLLRREHLVRQLPSHQEQRRRL
mmetsp:Transcript_44057/g.122063  ORF Transcript_44057/g.122063 Transcript_44057/m.122063 type:complete len:236 (-) Transcript_44057:3435-4142(-)